MISIHHKTADKTIMHTSGQRFLNQRSTARTYLGCVAWINQYNHTASILSFVRDVVYKLVPSRIRDAFCQTMVLKHVPDVQIFKSQQTKTVHQLTTSLMSKVPAAVGDTLMDMGDNLAPHGSFGCSLLSLREFALCFCQRSFVSAVQAGVGNPISVRECSKTFQSKIDPDCQITNRHWCRFNITSK